jgi:probable HAF family extracellular repeat protein
LAISGDGTVVVGDADSGTEPAPLSRAVRWTVGVPIEELVAGAGHSSFAFGVSRDGRWVAGVEYIGNNASRAMLWSRGAAENLGVLPGLYGSWATAVSADGGVVVGDSSNGPPIAFVWTRAQGMRDLRAVLAAQGANVAGWSLSSARRVSDDGRTIVGDGIEPGGHTRAWFAHLPPGFGCYANCDGSTAAPALNAMDFTCFLGRFAAGDPYANCDGSTGTPALNLQDFTCFLQKFGAGCP